MPDFIPDANEDSVDEMGEKLVELGRLLRHFRWVKPKGESYSPEYSNYVYHEANCIRLQGEIAKLMQALKDVAETEASITVNKKRIIAATFAALYNPSRANCDSLEKLATKVQGARDRWGHVGLVLATIALFICGVVPGLLFLTSRLDTDDFSYWDDKGLAKAARDMANAVREETPRNPVRSKNRSEHEYIGRFWGSTTPKQQTPETPNTGGNPGDPLAVAPSAPPVV
jgi:hypothetical protein